jgi:hypothetical protein
VVGVADCTGDVGLAVGDGSEVAGAVVLVGVGVAEGVVVIVGVAEGVNVTVGDAVCVGVGVSVAVGEGVGVGSTTRTIVRASMLIGSNSFV